MNKKFDCVEMKYRAAQKIRKEIKHFTLEEELNFWNKKTELLQKRKKQIHKSQSIVH